MINRFLVLAAIAMTPAVAQAPAAGPLPHQQPPALPPAPLALEHSSVIDLATGRLLRDHTVLVRGTRITAVGLASSVRVPPGARRIDARAAYLIPGLWDMHGHLVDPDAPGPPELAFALMLANGVTGLRDMGSSDLDSILGLRADIRAGRLVGPRLVVAGRIIEGHPMVFPPAQIRVRTSAEARRVVDSLASLGVDFVKLYEMLPRDVFLAAVGQARRHGLPVAGHLPLAVDAAEASGAGMHIFEHLRNLELACSNRADSLRAARTAILAAEASRADTVPVRAFAWSHGYGAGALVRARIHLEQRPRALDTYDARRCGLLLQQFAAARTWQDPTLLVVNLAALRPDTMVSVRAALRYVPAANRAAWAGEAAKWDSIPPAPRAYLVRHRDWYFQLVRMMREAGVRLLAGTDFSNPFLVPGFALHEELALLVRSGLNPLEALRSATLNPARALGLADSLGTVAPGKVADLVLLDGDPLADIRHTRRVRAVVANGHYLDRAALDALLSDAENRASGTGPAHR